METTPKTNPLLEQVLSTIESNPKIKETQDKLTVLLNADVLDKDAVNSCLKEYETFLSTKDIQPPFGDLPQIDTKHGKLSRLWSPKEQVVIFQLPGLHQYL